MKVIVLMMVITSVVMMGATEVHGGRDDDLVKKYGIMKIFESCFGVELQKVIMKKKHDAEAKCQQLPVGGAERAPEGTASPESQQPTAPEGATAAFQFFTADRVRSVSKKIQAKVSNKTCLYKEVGYMDASDELLYDVMISDIKAWKLEAELEKDLVESVTLCQKMAACVPATNIQVPLTPALLRFKVFKKCHMQFKLNACIKKDLRSKQAEFDLTELSDPADDDEKMLTIIWGNSIAGTGYIS